MIHVVQLEIILLQSNKELKAMYNKMSLLKFYKSYTRKDEFQTLKKHALKYASICLVQRTAASSSFQNSQL